MLESKAFPAHFLLTYVQTQTNTLVYIIHWGICFNFPLCWPSLNSVFFWVVRKLISWQPSCYICLLINTRIYLPLACSEHLLSQFSVNSAAPNLCRLIFYDRDLQKPTLGPTTARNCQLVQWKKSFSPLHLSSLGITICIFFFMSLDSRLGGWQPHCWKFQPDPGAEARVEVDSTVAEAFYLEKLWCWKTCKQFTLQGFGFFRRWRAVTLLTY